MNVFAIADEKTKTRLVAAAFGLITFIVYYLTSHGEGAVYNYHTLLAQAMLNGRLDYGHDISYFEIVKWQGKFFTVFPPLPAALLLPFVWLWGVGVYQPLLSISCGAVSASVCYLFIYDYFLNRSLAFWTTLAYSFGTIVWYHSEVGSGWYVAQIVGLFFAWIGLYAGLVHKRYVISGLAFGAAYLARIPCLACIVALPLLDVKAWIPFSLPALRVTAKNALLMGLGLLPGLLLTAAYNYARFGRIDNAAYDILTATLIAKEPWYAHGLLSFQYVPTHLWEMFTGLPRLVNDPPYVVPNLFAMAVWFTTPAFVYCVRGAVTSKTGALAALAMALAALPSLVHGSNGFSQFGYRFTLDYMPLIILLMAFGLKSGVSHLARGLIILGIIINLWGVVMISWLGKSSM